MQHESPKHINVAIQTLTPESFVDLKHGRNNYLLTKTPDFSSIRVLLYRVPLTELQQLSDIASQDIEFYVPRSSMHAVKSSNSSKQKTIVRSNVLPMHADTATLQTIGSLIDAALEAHSANMPLDKAKAFFKDLKVNNAGDASSLTVSRNTIEMLRMNLTKAKRVTNDPHLTQALGLFTMLNPKQQLQLR